MAKAPQAPQAPQATPQAPEAPATEATTGQSVTLRPTTLADVQALTPIRTRKNRQTGTRINLWAPLPNTADGGGTSTYVVQCQDHGTVVASYTTRKAAKATVYLPQHWCPGCDAALKAVQAAAKATPAPAEAPAK